MDLIHPSIRSEVFKIANQPAKPVHFYYLCTILAGDKPVPILKILNLDIDRDFGNNYTDFIVLSCAIPAGTYMHDIYPYRDNLECVITRRPIYELRTGEDFDRDLDVKRYRVALYETGDPALSASDYGFTNKEAADLMQIVTVNMQLVDPAIEQIRGMTTGGLFRNSTGMDVAKFLMDGFSKKAETDQEVSIKGVDVAPGFNTAVRNVINIPATQVVDIPDQIHKHHGGLYGAGLGYYLWRQVWYIYPLYDHTRFDSTPKTLTVINIPTKAMPGIERTYRVTNNQVTILCTGEIIRRDDSEKKQLNSGNGVRYTVAEKVMGDFVTVADNKAVAARGGNNSEYLTEQRKTGLNNVRVSADRISSNPLLEMSKLARGKGAHIQLSWENANSELIYPGMPVRLLYVQNENVETLHGTVVHVYDAISLVGKGVTANRHRAVTAITLFVERHHEWAE